MSSSGNRRAPPPQPTGAVVLAPGHIPILDGWRALSITFVLAGHLLPLGPKALALNRAVGTAGMAIFFTLSGLLITRFLLERPDAVDFLIRRLFRILPLAWTATAILAVVNLADAQTTIANFAFVSNLPPIRLLHGGGHLWSLCVEMQFYIGMAALVALIGRRGLYAVPVIGLVVTAGRIATQTPVSIVTWQRIDEIAAGACLALLVTGGSIGSIFRRLPTWSSPVMLLVLVASAHPLAGALNYARPYIAAATVGVSLYVVPAVMRRWLESATARYVAEISYALYVIHGMLIVSWLGAGDLLQKYAKRPLLLLVTFALAHVSTFWFERPLIAAGKTISRRRAEGRLRWPLSLDRK